MSTESVRARLAAATPGPWYHVYQTIAQGASEAAIAETSEQVDRVADAALIASARTDLELALEVIEAAKQRHAWLADNGHCWCAEDPGSCDLGRALDAWEATP